MAARVSPIGMRHTPHGALLRKSTTNWGFRPGAAGYKLRPYFMDANTEKILSEIRSDKVTLTCGVHNYVAARRRANATVAVPPVPNGCKDCWMVYYVTDLALTPPAKRQERVDELEEVIHHAIEFEQKGRFGKDFELYDTKDPRFAVEIERGVELTDDDTKSTSKLPD